MAWLPDAGRLSPDALVFVRFGSWCFPAVWAGRLLAGTCVHELGRYVAARLALRRVKAVHIFRPPARVTRQVGSVQLCLGTTPGGQLEYDPGSGSAGRVIVTVAGAAASVLARHALGQPGGDELLAEAATLDPAGDLVGEATSVLISGSVSPAGSSA